jgi:hypothetical protein
MDKAMEAAWLAGGIALHEHAPDLGMIARTAIVQVVCEAAIPAYVRATPEPVAPPSPDIAGLVERLLKGNVAYELDTGTVYKGPNALHREAATALQRVAQEPARSSCPAMSSGFPLKGTKP